LSSVKQFIKILHRKISACAKLAVTNP